MAKIEIIDGRAVKTYSEEELKYFKKKQKKRNDRKKSSNKKYKYPRGSRGGRGYRRTDGGVILMGEEKKLNKKQEFLKEHPSLKGMITFTDGYGSGLANEKGYAYEVDLENVHKTQLDKQKVKESISPLIHELEKHIGREGTITITKEMCGIILLKLNNLVRS